MGDVSAFFREVLGPFAKEVARREVLTPPGLINGLGLLLFFGFAVLASLTDLVLSIGAAWRGSEPNPGSLMPLLILLVAFNLVCVAIVGVDTWFRGGYSQRATKAKKAKRKRRRRP